MMWGMRCAFRAGELGCLARFCANRLNQIPRVPIKDGAFHEELRTASESKKTATVYGAARLQMTSPQVIRTLMAKA